MSCSGQEKEWALEEKTEPWLAVLPGTRIKHLAIILFLSLYAKWPVMEQLLFKVKH